MHQLQHTDVPSEIANRIMSAADQLYEEGGRASFPNVDTVRRRARVNMNDASAVMRVWRRNQVESSSPAPAAIPDHVIAASQALLSAVWAAANESANSNLQLAQAGWALERTEMEACRQQLAGAFDSLAEELTQTQRHEQQIEQTLSAQLAEMEVAKGTIEALRSSTAEAEARAAVAEMKSLETNMRVGDLKDELTRARAIADEERRDARCRIEAAESLISSLRKELREKTSHESEAREQLARLRGHYEVLGAEAHSPISACKGNENAASERPDSRKPTSPNGKKPQGAAG